MRLLDSFNPLVLLIIGLLAGMVIAGKLRDREAGQ